MGAALTVLRASTSRADRSRPIRSGPSSEWARWVRDALLWLGEADPCGTMQEQHRTDPVLEALSDVMAAWKPAIGCEARTLKNVIALANSQRQPADSMGFGRLEPAYPELRDALLSVAAGPGWRHQPVRPRPLAWQAPRQGGGGVPVQPSGTAGRPHAMAARTPAEAQNGLNGWHRWERQVGLGNQTHFPFWQLTLQVNGLPDRSRLQVGPSGTCVLPASDMSF